MVHFPAVVHDESPVVHDLGHFGLGEHEEGLDGVKFLAGFGPEIDWYAVGHVYPEAVDTDILDPVGHGRDHAIAHFVVVVVEVGHVGPAPAFAGGGVDGVGDLAILFGVEVGVLLDPGVIPAGVVGHPVDDGVHAGRVDGVEHLPEVLHGAEVGVDVFVVGYRVGATEFALAVFLADGVDGHEPKNVDAHIR